MLSEGFLLLSQKKGGNKMIKTMDFKGLSADKLEEISRTDFHERRKSVVERVSDTRIR
jgi:hypothetical protein